MFTLIIVCLIAAAIVCYNNPSKSIVSETLKAFFGVLGACGCLLVIFVLLLITIFLAIL